MRRLAVLLALCFVPSLLCAAPRKRAKSENYGTMRIQAEVFDRLIRHVLPLNAESLVFLSVYVPEDSISDASGNRAIDPDPHVKRWAGHAKYTKMQSIDEVYKRRLAKKYRHSNYDSESYGGIYLIIEDIKWITPRDVEVEATILGKDWGEADYSSAEMYRYKLRKQDNHWVAISEQQTGAAG